MSGKLHTNDSRTSLSGLGPKDLAEFAQIWQADDLTNTATKSQMLEFTDRLLRAVQLVYGSAHADDGR